MSGACGFCDRSCQEQGIDKRIRDVLYYDYRFFRVWCGNKNCDKENIMGSASYMLFLWKQESRKTLKILDSRLRGNDTVRGWFLYTRLILTLCTEEPDYLYAKIGFWKLYMEGDDNYGKKISGVISYSICNICFCSIFYRKCGELATVAGILF